VLQLQATKSKVSEIRLDVDRKWKMESQTKIFEVLPNAKNVALCNPFIKLNI
jgi:hypothetical protein